MLPLEAYLDAQIATLLYMVDHDMDSSLAGTALYQMLNKDSKSSSWFVYSYIRLKRYDLDPLDILQNYISKGDIRRTIRSYWFNIITNEAKAIGEIHVDMKRKSDNARKNNIMFYGITEDESWEQTEDKVREILHTDAQIDNAKSPEGLQIERAQCIGVERTGKIRPVLVRFTQLKQRYQVMDIAPL